MRYLVTVIIINVFTGFTAIAEPAVLNPKQGLQSMQAELSALPSRTPSENLALAATRFLRGIEKSLQVRYDHNLTLEDMDFPLLRLPIPPNPNAKPFEPRLIVNLFSDLLVDMEITRQALAEIPEGPEVALDVDLTDLWFDYDSNGQRDTGEDLLAIVADILDPRGTQGGSTPVSLSIRFDAADARWLAAYTHFLSGISELVVAFDPTEAITTVLTSRLAMNDLRGGVEWPNRWYNSELVFIDMFAIIYGAINVQPDAEITRRAHGHFLQMIAENREFWRLVALETDNHNEWIPNDNQTAALGFDLPPNTGGVWQSVLADAEAVLNGDLLIPYYWIEPVGGVNVKKLFMDPPVVDIVTWVQGSGLLPYLEKGPVVADDSLNRFDDLFAGDAVLFMVLLN